MIRDYALCGYIFINQTNCIRHTFSKTHCRDCEDICPTDAIIFSPTPRINSKLCLECGLCYSACRFSAVGIQKDDLFVIKNLENEGVVDIGCIKANSKIKVTCLSRLTEILFLSWALDDKQIILKKGNCNKCKMKTSLRYFKYNLRKASIIAKSLNIEIKIRLKEEPSEGIYIPKTSVSRREVFTSLTNRLNRVSLTTKRELLIKLMKSSSVSLKLEYPEIGMAKVSHDCNLCGVCEHVCSMNAILIKTSEKKGEIYFNPSLCINCKECEKACIKEAIHIEQATTFNFGDKPHKVFEAKRIVCKSCKKEFYSLEDQEICPVCKNKEEAKKKFLEFLKNI